MRTALKPGTVVRVNGIDYIIHSLISASGGMSLLYEAMQRVDGEGFASKTVIKEFFPVSNATRNAEGRVCCASNDPEDIRHFESLRQSMIDEGVIGVDAQESCSQVYAFDHAWDGYAVMRKLSRDTRSLADILNAWQKNAPSTDEEYTDMARLRYALRITHSILTGLQTIHNVGIIHRDISLGNIVWASADFAKDGRDGQAYFLDFGSALRMDSNREAQNVTDPLMLFGTYSFAAPEIWQLGASLTPSTDLFSVAAILLLLCCGKKCCIRMKPGWHLASQANVGRLYESDFVVRSSLEKLNIPADIRGRLLDFLLAGLDRDPARRFGQSAQQMLEALEKLQLKCAPRQRLREYAAFISYHHRPLDIAVARKLHRLIEQYRIPAELAKGRESRKLGLVFRDEDELPVSTDLTDNIQEALDHSDFLIVICTPGTPKSIWVEQEIAYFLRHHDRNHVLAVLAEGRPEQSFPPHLVHLYDADGRVVGDTEYLAANIAGRNKAEALRNLNREKLRIIAAIIGCPYDSLVQREKRYRVQRIAAASGAAVVILAVFSMIILLKNAEISEKNRVIERQYTEVLTNESIALSNEAQLKYQDGDVIGALECALAATPDETNGRPYTPISEQVLSDVLAPYTFGDARIVSILYQDTDIAGLELDEAASAVYSIDKYGCVRAFDIHSGEIKWTYDLESSSLFDSVSIQLLREQHRLIAHTPRELCVLDCDSGAAVWKKVQRYGSFQASGDGKCIVVFDDEYTDGVKHYVAEYYAVENGALIRSVNCDSVCVFDTLTSLDYTENYLQMEATFPDPNHLFGVSYYSDSYKSKTAEMVLYVIDDGDTARTLYRQTIDMEADEFLWPIALRYYEKDNALMVILINRSAQKMMVEKVSVANGSIVYSREYPWTIALTTSYRCFASSETHAFLGLGNDMFCFDVETGDVLAKSLDNSTNFGVVYMDSNMSNAGYVVTDSGIYCMLACINGDIVYGNFNQQRLNLGSLLDVSLGNRDCITPVENGGNFATGYVARLNPNSRVAAVPKAFGNRIIILQPRLGSASHMNGIGVDWQEYLVDPSGRYLIDRDGGRLFDLENERSFVLSGWNPMGDFDDIAFSTERHTAVYFTDEGFRVCNLDDGAVKSVKLAEIANASPEYPLNPRTVSNILENEDAALLMENDLMKNITNSLTTPYLTRRNCIATAVVDDGALLTISFANGNLSCWTDGEPLEVRQPSDALPEYAKAIGEMYESTVRVLTDGRHIVVANAEDTPNPFLLIYDLKTNNWKVTNCDPLSGFLSSGNLEYAFCLSKQSGKLAYVTDEDTLVIYDLEQGELSLRVPMEARARSIEDLRFFDQDKKILCLEESRVLEYDVTTGEMRACEYYHTFKGVTLMTSLCNITIDEGRRRLYICDPLGSEPGICIDMDSWTRIATIPYQITYSAPLDHIILYDFPGYWHPNVIGYVSAGDLPEDQCGICSVPALGLSDLRAEGLSIIHPNKSSLE